MEKTQKRIARLEKEICLLQQQINDYRDKRDAAYSTGNRSSGLNFELAARPLAAAVEDREIRLGYLREHNYEGE